ncbi:MAG: hypothetical protein HQ518_03970 [Rhodopirellula sp.]|nr:hypothetical protein [Rhodopirellula sp.]
MDKSQRLIDLYLPPAEGFVLESLLATTYQVDFEFFEEELLAAALGVRSPISRMRAFRSELERRLQKTDVSVLYDLRGCERLARISPRIDPIPIVGRKLHSKISLLMWVRHASDEGVPDRVMRLIVGSANLTRQGFRENYECIVPVDFGGRSRSPRVLLTSAIDIVVQIAAESDSPQLEHQLELFRKQVAALDDGEFAKDDPIDLVIANEVLPRIETRWAESSNFAPEKLTVVSPFWPEGVTAADALVGLIERFQSPGHVELVCRGVLDGTGHDWLPEFDADLATSLKGRLAGRLYLRAALPDSGTEESDREAEEIGDETEEQELAQAMISRKSNNDQIQRHLHAKMIILDGAQGSVLYAGSSNCTRRGLGLGGPTNWEAGLIYRLTPKQRRLLQSLQTFFGPATEVLLNKPPRTEKPTRDEEPAVPWFLSEVTAEGTTLTVSFREGVSLPDDLVVLMEIPSRVSESVYWLIHQQDPNCDPVQEVIRELVSCPKCDSNLVVLPKDDTVGQTHPHVFVEIRWQGNCAAFPVRFDDKAALPLLLVGRKPTEGELIEYFLFGREPGDDNGIGDGTGTGGSGTKPDGPIDTRRILAYFMRHFVQAIPGIEAELQQASYSRTALDAALRGPTSPLELAERAFASLNHPPHQDEPEKTPTAVGFQLTEILAALLRAQVKIEDETLKECFVPVIGRCRALIAMLVACHPELGDGVFRMYQDRFVGGSP